MGFIGDPGEVSEQVQALLDAGLDGVTLTLPDVHDLETVALAGETLGAVIGTRDRLGWNHALADQVEAVRGRLVAAQRLTLRRAARAAPRGARATKFASKSGSVAASRRRS